MVLRAGVLVPYTNTNLERDLARLPLTGVEYHVTRIGGYEAEGVPGAAAMQSMGHDDLSEPLALISGVRPNVVLYACTSATLTNGLAYTRKLEADISRTTGATGISAAGAVITALSCLGVRQLAFASPYVGEINDQACNFLAEANFRVISRADVGANLTSLEQGLVTPEQVVDLACKADRPSVEAIVLLCTDLRAVEAIPAIEGKTGKPVVTSNQAIVFAAARFLEVKPSIELPGALFRHRL